MITEQSIKGQVHATQPTRFRTVQRQNLPGREKEDLNTLSLWHQCNTVPDKDETFIFVKLYEINCYERPLMLRNYPTDRVYVGALWLNSHERGRLMTHYLV